MFLTAITSEVVELFTVEHVCRSSRRFDGNIGLLEGKHDGNRRHSWKRCFLAGTEGNLQIELSVSPGHELEHDSEVDAARNTLGDHWDSFISFIHESWQSNSAWPIWQSELRTSPVANLQDHHTRFGHDRPGFPHPRYGAGPMESRPGEIKPPISSISSRKRNARSWTMCCAWPATAIRCRSASCDRWP